MIISPSLNMIFVHVPKTAGSTVESLLAPWLNAASDLHLSRASKLPLNFLSAGVNPESRLEKHSSADQIRKAMNADAFQRAFSFAMCRNPFARAFSAYRYVQERARKDAGNAELTPNALQRDRMSFLTRSFEEVCRDLPALSFVYQLFLPQRNWLPADGGLSFVGRVETLTQDMGHVFDALRLPKAGLANIPARNVKTAPGEWRGMPGACVDAIRSFYAVDFETFGYSPDPQAEAGGQRAPQPSQAPGLQHQVAP